MTEMRDTDFFDAAMLRVSPGKMLEKEKQGFWTLHGVTLWFNGKDRFLGGIGGSLSTCDQLDKWITLPLVISQQKMR